MKNGTIMINVPLSNYENGVQAIAQIEILKKLVINSNYGVSREDVACILGFDLSIKVKNDE